MSCAIYEKIDKKVFFCRFFASELYFGLSVEWIFRIFVKEICKGVLYMKYLFVVLGSLSLVLGIIGVFLPVLPTTPFLLMAAALYFRSSERLYNWLMSHRHLGPYIKNFRENRAIPMRVKVVSVSMVWITLLYCTVFVAWVWWMRLLFLSIAVGVTIHILHYRTLHK